MIEANELGLYLAENPPPAITLAALAQTLAGGTGRRRAGPAQKARPKPVGSDEEAARFAEGMRAMTGWVASGAFH